MVTHKPNPSLKFWLENVLSRLTSQKRRYILSSQGIVGSLEYSITEPTDFIWRLVASCVELRSFYRNAGSQFVLIADVDPVAAAVVSRLDTKASGTLRALEGLTFFYIWDVLQNRFGYVMQGIERDEWATRMTSEIRSRGKGHGLFTLLHMLEKDVGTTGFKVLDKKRTDKERMKRVVERNVQYLIDIGFFPEPPEVEGY
jgi:hypothetical protein